MAPTGDERFARLKTDPRFRRPKQKQLKVEIDDRFKDVLESEEFGGKGKGKGKGKQGRAKEVRVDKRGRPITSTHATDQLKRFYRLKSPSPGANGSAGGDEGEFIDYARGQGVLESSGSEDESEDGSEAESEASDEELELGGKRRPRLPGDYSASESDSDSDSASGEDEEDEDHLDIDLSETDEPPSAFPAESDIEQEDDEDEEDEGPTTDPTNRIACVNLDWDNLQAADLFAVFSSFLRPDARKIKGKKQGPGGRVESVKIYPSEFGKERMKAEEEQGPGGGVFVSLKKASKREGAKRRAQSEEDSDEEEEESDMGSEEDLEEGSNDGEVEEEASDFEEGSEDGEDSEQSGDEDDEGSQGGLPDMSRPSGPDVDLDSNSSRAGSEDIDMAQLRQYQLERLRYYYAVATFSTVEAAEYVMAECNGTEFERTANVFDLTYVPEGMNFEDDEIREEATKEPRGYKGNDFVTDALRHSKVKLTWDQDDPNRAKFTRKALTREEIEEQDFKNLVAGSESDSASASEAEPGAAASSEEEAGAKGSKAKEKAKKAKAKERKAALRALLLKGDDSDEEGAGDIWGKAGRYADVDKDDRDAVGDDADKHGGMEITFKSALADGATEDDNLTSLERYQMRQKEKKARKKEKLELKWAEKGDDAKSASKMGDKKGDDFFGDSDGDDAADNADDLYEDDSDEDRPDDVEDSANRGISGKQHFSMKDILTEEKTQGKSQSSRRKRLAQKKREAKNEELGRVREKELGQEGWKMDVQDPRFKALHEEAEFAIDPSNPAFIKTKAMQDMLAERTRVRNAKNTSDRPPIEKKTKAAPTPNDSTGDATTGPDLAQLVKSVKRKAGANGAAANVTHDKVDGAAADAGGKKRKRTRRKKSGPGAVGTAED